MKRLLVVALLVSLTLTGCFSIDVSGGAMHYEEATYTKEIQVNDEVMIDIQSDVADLTIRQIDTDKVTMEIHKRIGDKNERTAEEAFEKIDYILEVKEGRIEIRSTKDRVINQVNTKNLDCLIQIPKGIRGLEVNSDVGDINIHGNYDKLDIASDVGDIRFDGNCNSIEASADVGDISIYGEINERRLATDVGDIYVNSEKID